MDRVAPLQGESRTGGALRDVEWPAVTLDDDGDALNGPFRNWWAGCNASHLAETKGKAQEKKGGAMHLRRSFLPALKAVIEAKSPRDARVVLLEASKSLGHHADAVAPVLEAILARLRELDELRSLAGTDPLTGVANRRAFEDALRRELARRGRTEGSVALILLDLDGLKSINDLHGHAVGDEAIAGVARRSVETLRSTDVVARLGGDEFVALLPATDARRARAVAERLRRRIECLVVAGKPLRVSLGLAVTQPGLSSASALLEAADAELYRDKRGRRGRCAA